MEADSTLCSDCCHFHILSCYGLTQKMIYGSLCYSSPVCHEGRRYAPVRHCFDIFLNLKVEVCEAAPVISAERLKKYVFHKIHTELPEGPFCIVYLHSCVQKEDNSPGMTILRCIYEDLPAAYKSRLEIVYFVHPGIRSRLVLATLGRFFLSEGLYWKIKYVSRLQYLWDDIKKGQVEIPDFVKQHDDVLENRPLTDYGIEPDILPVNEGPMVGYSFMRHEDRWASRAYS